MISMMMMTRRRRMMMLMPGAAGSRAGPLGARQCGNVAGSSRGLTCWESRVKAAEEAGSAPFSLSVPKGFNHFTGVRCLRSLNPPLLTFTYLGFTCRSACVSDRTGTEPNLHTNQINNHEEGNSELSGSEEPVPVRHQYQDEGHG